MLDAALPQGRDGPGADLLRSGSAWRQVALQLWGLDDQQSIFLDGHFYIEHVARNRTGRFFNFNGTAGMWRKECIEAAGGWQGDTLTEDLDLSYRAQLQGWRFRFRDDVLCPAELPPTTAYTYCVELSVDEVVFAYSDVPMAYVEERRRVVEAAGGRL